MGQNAFVSPSRPRPMQEFGIPMWRTGGRLKMNWGVGLWKWIGLGSMLLSGCTTVAQITTLSDESCHRTVQGQLNPFFSKRRRLRWPTAWL